MIIINLFIIEVLGYVVQSEQQIENVFFVFFSLVLFRLGFVWRVCVM